MPDLVMVLRSYRPIVLKNLKVLRSYRSYPPLPPPLSVHSAKLTAQRY